MEPSGRNVINTRSREGLENQPKTRGRKVVEIFEESDEEISENEEEIPIKLQEIRKIRRRHCPSFPEKMKK